MTHEYTLSSVRGHRREPVVRSGVKEVVVTGEMAGFTKSTLDTVLTSSHWYRKDRVSGTTTCLLIGSRGWPVQRSGKRTAQPGRKTEKLKNAERLRAEGQDILIAPEAAALEMLDVDVPELAYRSRFGLVDAARMLGIEREVLRRCAGEGLIELDPIGRVDLREIRAAQTALEVSRDVGGLRRLARSLHSLRRYLPGITRPLVQVELLLDWDRSVVARVGDGLVREDGQLVFDFEQAEPEPVLSFPSLSTNDAAALLRRARGYEDLGKLDLAAEMYQSLIDRRPSGNACFNYANVLRELGHLDAAKEQYRQAVQLDPTHADAWYNLGNIEMDTSHWHEAATAFEAALHACPFYADACYNAGLCYQRLRDFDQAIDRFRRYRLLDRDSTWGDRALGAIERLSTTR